MEKQRRSPEREALRKTTRAYLQARNQCSQCVFLHLQDTLAPYEPSLLAAVGSLSRGIGGSGQMCGAVVAGVLALGIGGQKGSPASQEEARPLPVIPAVRPMHEWLDVFCPDTEPPLFAQCREFLKRVSARVQAVTGSLNCSAISGVEWSSPTPLQLSLYRGPEGGMDRCVEVILTTVEAVRELLPEQRGKRQGSSQTLVS